MLAGNEFEAPELEAALLKSLDSPRHEVSETLFDDIRRLSHHLPPFFNLHTAATSASQTSTATWCGTF